MKSLDLDVLASLARSNLRLLDEILSWDIPGHRNIVHELWEAEFVFGRSGAFADPSLNVFSQRAEQKARSERRSWMRLPIHIFPALVGNQEFGDMESFGAIIPIETSEGVRGDWRTSPICQSFLGDDPDWRLENMVASLEKPWHKTPLPLWGKCGLHIRLGVETQGKFIQGRSLELPLAILILRECCFQTTKERPFGNSPVFSTGTIADFAGQLEGVRGEELKLKAFLRECGDGLPAILLRRQMSSFDQALLARLGKIEPVDSIKELLEIEPFRQGLNELAEPPKGDQVARLQFLARSSSAPGAAMVSHYLIRHGRNPEIYAHSSSPEGLGRDANPPFAYSPPALGLFVGREMEREAAIHCLIKDRTRPLLIWGAPGVGKSTLALAILNHLTVVQRFGLRRFLQRCDALSSADAILAGMGLDWFGLEASPQMGGLVLSKLKQSPAVVVIDNFETPYRATPELCEDLLRQLLSLPDLWLIVGMQGHEFPAGIEWQRIEPKTMSLTTARELFCRITGNAAHEKDPHLNVLLSELDGVPHAIELLAHQAGDDTHLRLLSKRWQRQRTKLLKRGTENTRHTSLVISYECAIHSSVMNDPARLMLRILAAVPGGVAEQDLLDSTRLLDEGEIENAVATLKRCAIVIEEVNRFRILAPLRHYVAETYPVAPAEICDLRQKYLTLLTDVWNIGYEGGGESLRALTIEYSNLLWAVDSLIVSGNSLALQMALEFGQLCTFSGLPDAGIVERAKTLAADLGHVRGNNKLVLASADSALKNADYPEAERLFRLALTQYQNANDLKGQADSMWGLGESAHAQDDFAMAIDWFQKGMKIFKDVGSDTGGGNCALGLARITANWNKNAEARRWLGEASELYQKGSDLLGQGNCALQLGRIESDEGHWDEALALCDKAMLIFSKVGSPVGEANCLWLQGRVAFAREDYEVAIILYKKAISVFRQTGGLAGEANCLETQAECLTRLGALALKRGEWTEARKRFEEATPICRRLNARSLEASCMLGLATLAELRREFPESF